MPLLASRLYNSARRSRSGVTVWAVAVAVLGCQVRFGTDEEGDAVHMLELHRQVERSQTHV